MSAQHYLDELSDFICNTQIDDVDAQVRAYGCRVIADSIPVIAAGMQVAEMRALVEAQLQHAAPGRAWVIGSGRRAGAQRAALLNGTAGTWLELDEGNQYAKGHPGIQVVPAALAVAQELGSAGSELLLAVMLGYEVSARISRAANISLKVHPHGTYGVIGAAVAAGRLHGLAPAQMRNLISMAATLGLATSRNTLLEGSTVRNIYAGHSGFMGQVALDMARAGFTGEVDGVASVYAGVLSDRCDPDVAVAGLGGQWLMTLGYFKLHPAGRYVHSAIDALDDALSGAPQGRVDAASIERIEVTAYKLAAMLDGTQITTSFGARFSIPFALASMLQRGRRGLAAFDDEAVADPTVQSLARRVSVREDVSYTAAYPERNLCDVRIRMRDGSTLAGHCELTKGEPGNPHKEAELEEKFFELGRPVWGEAVTRQLYDACMDLERIDDFGRFSESLTL